MAKKSFTETGYRKNPWFRALCRALADCKTEKEVADFLRDVGTLSELQAWAERWEIAKQIDAGRTYREIADETDASTATVTRVAWFMENGAGGYLNLLDNHHHRIAPARSGRSR